jgi:hypothetical protein
VPARDGTAKLIVVKLGLPDETTLRQRALDDVGYPHHPARRQVYRRDRMEAYRDVGREVTARCMAAQS